jgi:NAF domain
LKNIDADGQRKPTIINAFQLIGMSSSLDLSGFFEKEVLSMVLYLILELNILKEKKKTRTNCVLFSFWQRKYQKGRFDSHQVIHQKTYFKKSRRSSQAWDS